MKNTMSLLVLFLMCQFTFSQSNIFDLARSGSVDQMETYLNQNPLDLNSKNPSGFTPLILACYRGNDAVAIFLIEKGANVDLGNENGTALMGATVKGNKKIVTFLIKNKANINIQDASGLTALHYAVQFRNYDLVHVLIQANANTAIKDNNGNSAKDYAKLSNDNKLKQLLNL